MPQRVFSLLLSILLSLVFLNPIPLNTHKPEIGDDSPHQDLVSVDQALTLISGKGIVINEIMYKPGDGQNEWVELLNDSNQMIDLTHYRLTDEDGNWFDFPTGLKVPSGDFVVIYFDGLGSAHNDLTFSDQTAVLHSPPGLQHIFDDEQDQAALYVDLRMYLPIVIRSSPLARLEPAAPQAPTTTTIQNGVVVSFLAWGGEPGDQAANASQYGVWREDWYVQAARGLGYVTPDNTLRYMESLGLAPGSSSAYPKDWQIFQFGETTPGAANLVSSPLWYFPPSGTMSEPEGLVLEWQPVPGATSYHFQMDQTSDFSAPVVNVDLSDAYYRATQIFSDNTYFWRVQAVTPTGTSSWTPAISIQIQSMSTTSLAPVVFKELAIPLRLQHKDTYMLDLDGSTETLQGRWDSSHETDGDLVIGDATPVKANDLDENYCARASIAMLAAYYGGELSQDRISYEIFSKNLLGQPDSEPEDDLGHGIGFTGVFYGLQTSDAVTWALGTSQWIYAFMPSFESIRSWIDEDRAIMACVQGHCFVINGYKISPDGSYKVVSYLDPWSGETSNRYADLGVLDVYVGPAGAAGAPDVKSDEDVDNDGIADTVDDSDGDGICDFDERNRFNTDPLKVDSDGDLVWDKQEVREYVFDPLGNYQKRSADIDWDGKRKELDKDNDRYFDDGAIDGCEDINFNGIYENELNESDNFNGFDENSCWLEVGSGSASGSGISSSAGNVSQPSIAIDSNGKVYVAWADDGGGVSVIKSKVWDGTSWIALATISGSTGLDAVNPSLRIGPGNKPYITWMESYTRILVATWNGSSWVKLGDTVVSIAPVMDIALSDSSIEIASNGTVYVTFLSNTFWAVGGNLDVLRWTGIDWVQAFSSASLSNVNFSKLATVISSDGVLWASLTSHNISTGLKSIKVYRSLNSQMQDANFVSYGETSSIALSTTANPYLALDYPLPRDIYLYWGTSWNALGDSASSGGISKTEFATQPSLDLTPDDRPCVTWSDMSTMDPEIYIRCWTPTANAWVELGGGSASGVGISSTQGGARTPAIAIAPDGVIYVVWVEETTGSQIFIKRYVGF